MTKTNDQKIAERDAKAGRRVKGMKTVLILSTIAAIVVMTIALAANVKF